ncbi:MAG: hypothetical protein ACTHOE_09575 [Conexibacter sp.]
MQTPSLDGCREKHRRGREHLEALNAAMLGYLRGEPKPYTVRGEFDPNRREYVFVGKIVEPMTGEVRWGVMFGDVLHNLGSALDHLVCQLVLLNTGKLGGQENQFPICSSGARYWSIGKNGQPSVRDSRLRGVSDEHKALIDGLQPYRAPDPANRVHALAGLRGLSNLDKHRLVHPTLIGPDAHDSDDFALVSNADAGDMIGYDLSPLTEDGETEILRAEFACPGPNPDVSVRGELPIGIGFGEPAIRLPAFFTLADEVEAIIEVFAPAFPS